MGEYSKALSYLEKDLEISKKTLPANHPLLASSYNNIGSVYYNMGEYSKALSYSERALDIRQRSLPPNHPHLKSVKKNIEIVKKKCK
jgi:tetratricopeptide (TPR) repeat protein